MNGVMSIILPNSEAFRAEVSEVKLIMSRPYSKNVAEKNLVFSNMRFIIIFPEIAERERVKEGCPHLKSKIRLVQHCAAISAIAEL